MNDIKQQLKETLGNINKSSSNKNQIVLKLKTLTPLYTGGIGQQGDQIHPSNLLGGIRHFSCLVARFLGEKDFETEVWGTAEESEPKAKQIALKWDTSELKPINFHNKKIKINNNKGWYFSSAFEGELTLQITKQFTKCDKNIKEQFEKFWNILLISIAIQIRHAMFGSKDQFGLGVLDLVNPEDFKRLFPKLNIPLNEVKDDFLDKENKLMNLKRYAFATITFRKASVNTFVNFKNETKLKLGLAIRYNLRNALRPDDSQKWKEIRHKMFGELNKYSSGVNISAAYGNEENPKIRVTIELKLDNKEDRAEVVKKIQEKLKNIEFIENIGYRIDNVIWKFGSAQKNENKVDWLNKLAGVL